MTGLFVNSFVCNNKIFGMLIGNIQLQFCASAVAVASLPCFPGIQGSGRVSHVFLRVARQTWQSDTQTIEYLDRDKLLIRTT